MPALDETLALPAPPPGGLGQNGAIIVSSRADLPSPSPPSKSEIVPTTTAVVGIIRPPPDIRSIVDKTAQFVARNGPEFEKRILANEKNNVKFNFLNSTDPYHAYYQHRVKEFREQLAGGAAPLKPSPDGQAVTTEPAKEEEVKAPAPQGKSLVEPEPEQYTVRLPEGITGQDLDVIKLAAQFVARNGKSFMTGLTSREHSNPRFNFLKPTHSLYTFFTALSDAYSKVLMPPKGLVERLQKDASNKTAVLERCLQRLEWDKSQERARKKAEDELEAERVQMALIDWHDFVVVETIDFTEEEEPGLPQPMTHEEVVRRSKATEEEAEARPAVPPPAMDVEMDAEEVALVREGMQAATLEGREQREGDDMVEDMEEDMEDDERPIRVVKNWKRPEERAPQEQDPTKFVVSPITGELIPVAEMAEHMRISLIDPKYKEQKERMMAKLRETTLAHDDEISKNMLHLAKTRPDIFGTTEEEVSNAVAKEVERQKNADAERVIWDGHTASRPPVNTIPAPPTLNPVPPPPPPSAPVPRPQLPLPRPPPLSAPPLAPLPVRPSPAMLGMPPPPPVHNPYAPPQPSYPTNVPPPAPLPPALQPQLAPPPPPPNAFQPPSPREQAPPIPDERDAKRQKVDEVSLVPEEQFLAQHPGPTRIVIALPIVEENAALNGQTVDIAVESLRESIGAIKNKLADLTGLPGSKQKISGAAGFLKDTHSLAHYNIVPGEVLTLSLKERGGRKK